MPRITSAFILFAVCIVPAELIRAEAAAHKHTVGIFAGITDDDSETETTGGVEYEYLFNSRFGAGVVYEHTPDAHHADGVSVYLVAGYWHPYAGWRLGLGAGQEKVHASGEDEEGLARFSVAYDFHLAGFIFAPNFSVDRVNGRNIEVYGISLMKGF